MNLVLPRALHDLERELFGLPGFATFAPRTRRPATPTVRRARPASGPRFGVATEDDAYVIKAALPGMTAEALDIRLEGNQLVLSGERKSAAPEGYRPARRERWAQAFEQRFRLPDDVDADRIEAQLVDGRFTLTLPRAAAAKARQITVRSGTPESQEA